MNNTPDTARQQLITLLNTYRNSVRNIDQFAKHHALTSHHATALLWLASEVERL